MRVGSWLVMLAWIAAACATPQSVLPETMRLKCGEVGSTECMAVAQRAIEVIAVDPSTVQLADVESVDCRQLGAQLFRSAELGGAEACWVVEVEYGAVVESLIVYRDDPFGSLIVTPWDLPGG